MTATPAASSSASGPVSRPSPVPRSLPRPAEPVEPTEQAPVEAWPTTPPVRSRRPGRAERAAWRAEFDALVAREHPRLVAECAMLVDDEGRAARLVRKGLERVWRDWQHAREEADPGELVRAWVHQHTAARPGSARGRWWRRRATAGERGAADTLTALRAMPQVQRRALVLRHGTGRTLEQIAEVEGTSGQAVRMRLAHAAHAMAHHHPATPTIPISVAWPDLPDASGEDEAPR
jgi:RNA polymerase sigma-70 factor, ECF subfamily